MNIPRYSTSRGFTLIELLAVIAIIGIIAAILIPVLTSVRTQSQIAKNLSNLRNIQIANITYSNEHDGQYVPVASWDNEGGKTFWHDHEDFRKKYLGISASGSWPDGMISPLATSRNSAGDRMIHRSYGYNFTTVRGDDFGTPGLTRGGTIMLVANPSKTLAFADALDWQIQMSGADRYSGNEELMDTNKNNAIAYRYDGYAGVVFFDGHTEMLSREEVIDNKALWEIKEQ